MNIGFLWLLSRLSYVMVRLRYPPAHDRHRRVSLPNKISLGEVRELSGTGKGLFIQGQLEI